MKIREFITWIRSQADNNDELEILFEENVKDDGDYYTVSKIVTDVCYKGKGPTVIVELEKESK
jgi:hypothetical protein